MTASTLLVEGPSTREQHQTWARPVHVAAATIGVEGPIREHYLVTVRDTPDETRHRIEVAWPIFQTALPA